MVEKKYATLIDANDKYRLTQISQWLAYKDLLYFFVVKDIKVSYSQAYLGIGWAVFSPAIRIAILTLVFSKLAGIKSDDIPYPLFCLVGILAWTYFLNSINTATSSLISNHKIISKVYFPRLFIPITPLFSKLIDLFIGLLFVVFFMMYYGIGISDQLLFFPFVLVLLIITTTGAVLWFSCLALQYRDIKYAINFLMQMLIFVSPIVFPANLVKEKIGYMAYCIYGLYPVVGIIEGFRSTLLGINPIPWDLLFIGTISGLLFCITGFFYFQRMEKTFADL
ncbi:MAG: type transporter [Cytophagaceae bacterium]|jgi:lipopolysaccharide transport system permease protein|nr:type transporter [Cytophagaceae bacterium]